MEGERGKIFFQGRRLDGKNVINFWRGFRVFRDDHCKFHFTTLIWLTIFEETERHCITCYFSLMFLAYFISFISLKVFLMFYFLSIASLRGKKCIEVKRKWVLKYLKSIIFFFHFQRYTKADLKISLHACVHIKTIPFAFLILKIIKSLACKVCKFLKK